MTVTNSVDLKNFIQEKKTAVALGSFDALHRGHIKVIGKAIEYAKENGLLSLVQLVELPGSDRVNTLKKRLEILENMGADAVVVEEFTESFKSVGYREFVSEYLAKRYNAKAVFTGDNYRFGHMAQGDVDILCTLCQKQGIDVFVEPCMKLDKVISSTEIRGFVADGKIEKAQEYMGRPFSISGEVVHGRALGRTIGFPTANIDIPEGIVVPGEGVYAVRVLVDGELFHGVANVGKKPTVKDNAANIETHIFDFVRDVYGKEIEVEFRKKIRDVVRFESVEELSLQIERDKLAAKDFFENEKELC